MQNKNSFESLGLSIGALRSIKKLGYVQPTPIQTEAIPEILNGGDIIAAAETGTGKTAAFLLPLLNNLKPVKDRKRPPRILIISPTRELAEQISKTSFTISKCCNLFTTCLFGGSPYGPQIKSLKQGCDILVATPGRLCDLMEKGVVTLSDIQCLVLDEADRMLDMGFLPDVKRIVAQVPENRQTLLFSATIDAGIKNNFSDLLRDPKLIQIASCGKASDTIDQYVLPVAQKEKSELLKCLLDEKGHDKVIVFARTKSRVDGVAKMLEQSGYDVALIHSGRTQGQRKAALSDFRKGRVGVLVATDVLARGIDVPEVEYVINYDLPDMAQDYIHRIGRTGRAGNIGFSVSFVSHNSLKSLDAIESLLGKEIPVMRMSSYDLDMQILKKQTRTGRKKGSKPTSSHATRSRKGQSGAKHTSQNKPKSKGASYNYDGWGDLRKGKKRNAVRPGFKSSGLSRRKSK